MASTYHLVAIVLLACTLNGKEDSHLNIWRASASQERLFLSEDWAWTKTTLLIAPLLPSLSAMCDFLIEAYLSLKRLRVREQLG